MDHTRYNPLDAQRFDPLLRTHEGLVSLFNTSASKLITGPDPCVRTEQARARDVWLDHEAVDPFDGGGSHSEGSCSSCTLTSAVNARATSPMPVDVYDHDDIVVTRTIIRPNPNPHRRPARTPSRIQMVLTRIFSRWLSPTRTYFPPQSFSSVRPRSTHPRRSKRLARVLRALNCFSTSSAFERDADDIEMQKRKRPVLLVIVKETKERYKDDRAFKEIVTSVFPAAGVRGGA